MTINEHQNMTWTIWVSCFPLYGTTCPVKREVFMVFAFTPATLTD